MQPYTPIPLFPFLFFFPLSFVIWLLDLIWEVELPSEYKETKVFNHELQQARDISEKVSLSNLFRSSQKLTYEAVCVCSAFPLGKKKKGGGKHMAKTTNEPKLWHTFGEDSFHLRMTESVFGLKAFSLFSVIQKETVIFLVHAASFFSSAQHSSLPPPVTLCLKTIHCGLLFYFIFPDRKCTVIL